MQAISKSVVVSEIDNEFYYRLGLFLVCMFTSWFVLAFLVLFLTWKKERGDRFRIMTLFMYYPTRLSFVVWGPWLVIKAKPSHTDADDNLYTAKVLQKVSDCTDEYTNYDTSAIQSNLVGQGDQMFAIMICFWTSLSLSLVELVFWIIYWTRSRMDAVAQEEFAH